MAGRRTRRLLVALFLIAVFFGGAGLGCHFYRYKVAPYGVRGYLRQLRERDTDFIDRDVANRTWQPLIDPRRASQPVLTPQQRDALEQVAAIGYLDGYDKAPKLTGVTRHDAAAACPGLNLYVSGHAPEALLIDMDGAVRHTWACDLAKVWPDYPKGNDRGAFNYWRRVHLFPNGDILAIFDALALIKIDKDSNLLWIYRAACHHDLSVTDNGDIYVLTEESKMTRYHPDLPLLDNFIVQLDAAGHELRKVSLLKCLEQSPYAPLLGRIERVGDVFHTNTLEIFDGRLAPKSPLFRKGLALVSVRQLDTVAIVDLDAEHVVWALSGLWHMQHQPTLLDNGDLLVFDNQGCNGRSKVIEVEPLTQHVVWQYAGDASNDFYSELSGSCQRLPSGNTLITESNRGRAFEVTPEGKIAWEFFNPHRAGDNNELIATLFELVRIPEDYPAFLAAAAQ